MIAIDTIRLTAASFAGGKALKRAGMVASDIDLFEINEAFAAVPLRDVPPVVLSEAMRDVDLFVGVTSIAADIRAHLVDTTDDRIAMAEARAASVPGARPGGRPDYPDTEPGVPAWFDPFRQDDEP